VVSGGIDHHRSEWRDGNCDSHRVGSGRRLGTEPWTVNGSTGELESNVSISKKGHDGNCGRKLVSSGRRSVNRTFGSEQHGLRYLRRHWSSAGRIQIVRDDWYQATQSLGASWWTATWVNKGPGSTYRPRWTSATTGRHRLQSWQLADSGSGDVDRRQLRGGHPDSDDSPTS